MKMEGALVTRIIAIRISHPLGRNGDFERAAFMIIAPINDAKRESGVKQRLPLNPGMSAKGRSKLNLTTPTWGKLREVAILDSHFDL